MDRVLAKGILLRMTRELSNAGVTDKSWVGGIGYNLDVFCSRYVGVMHESGFY